MGFYFLMIVFEFIALTIDSSFLHKISNYLSAPLIILIYILVSKEKFKYYFIIVILFLYATDVFHLHVKQDINNLFCVYLNTVSYLVLSVFLIKQIKINFLFLNDLISVLSFLIITGFYLYIFFIVEGFLHEVNTDKYTHYLVYEILMLFMSVIVAYRFLNRQNLSNLYLMIVVTCLMISDFFYLMKFLYDDFKAFKFLLYIPQLIVYFFLLKYELTRVKIFKIFN